MPRDTSSVLPSVGESQNTMPSLPPIDEFVSKTKKNPNTEQEYFEEKIFRLKAPAIGSRAQGRTRAEYLAKQSESSGQLHDGETADDPSLTGHGESGGSRENHCHRADARNLLTGHNLGEQPTICSFAGTGNFEPETWRMQLDTALSQRSRVCDCSDCLEQESNLLGRLYQPNEQITTEFLTSNRDIVRGTNTAIVDRQVPHDDGRAVDHRHPEGSPLANNLPVANSDGLRDKTVSDSGCGDTGDWLDIPEANGAPAVNDDRDLLPSRRGPTPASPAFKPRHRSTISTAKRLRRAAAARLARMAESDQPEILAEPPYTTRDMQASMPRRRPLSFADEVIKLTDSEPAKSKLDRTIMEKVGAHLKRLEWTKVRVEGIYNPVQFLARLYRHIEYRCTGHYRAHLVKRRGLEIRFPVYRNRWLRNAE